MSNAIALTVFAVLVAIPTVAAVRSYGEKIRPFSRRMAHAAAFDPRHQGMTYHLRED